jgi:rifamycin polyketide synthase modules 1, 2 and 3
MSALFLEELEAAAAPERIAVSDATEAVTYRDLCDQARAVAGWLCRRHAAPGFVLVKAVPDVRFVVTLLGVMYSGGTPVPVDPDLPAPALDFIRTKSQAIDILDPVPRASLDGVPRLDTPSAEVPALILFTSGTSGFPKGVIISNANLLASCRAMAAYLEYDRFPSAAVALPLHYSYALLSQVLCQLLIGGRVHLFSDLRNPLKFARTVDELRMQTFCGVPSTYHGLMRFHGLRPIRMPSVRVLCSAGAAMDLSAYTAVKEIFPNAALFNNYGMTEAAPRIAFCRDDDPRFTEATCGRPMDGVEVRIVDPETHDELPDGMRGVLVVRGPNVTSGYLNDPDLTARAFTRDGFLISGDVAYRDNGYLFICGRLDDMFNCGGEKVVPLEIERVLDRVPGVEMSAVAGVPDEQRGMVPAAFVKLAADLTRASLVQHLARELPISKIPQRFLEVRAFPMTSNGKVQRRRLSIDSPEFVVREIR